MRAWTEMVQELRYFVQNRKDKKRSRLVQKQTPSSTRWPHRHDTVLADKMTIWCQPYAESGGVWVEARSGFRTRLPQRGGGGGGGEEQLVSAGYPWRLTCSGYL